MEQVLQLNSEAKLSDHFTLGEMTKSSSHPEVYNIPSHEAIANLKRLCGWLEVLRKRYNDKYGVGEEPIRINSGYRSPQLNKKIGGAAGSNHLTGCAVDIRVLGMEQLIRYATILLDYADESRQDFDELLIERNRYGAIWLHFAVRPFSRSATQGDACQSKNRRKVAFIQA